MSVVCKLLTPTANPEASELPGSSGGVSSPHPHPRGRNLCLSALRCWERELPHGEDGVKGGLAGQMGQINKEGSGGAKAGQTAVAAAGRRPPKMKVA